MPSDQEMDQVNSAAAGAHIGPQCIIIWAPSTR